MTADSSTKGEAPESSAGSTTVDMTDTVDATDVAIDRPAGWSRRRTRLRRALLAIGAGVGMAASLPPFGFWIAAFPAVGLLWWLIEGDPVRSRAWTGWLAGLAYFGVSLAWAHAFTLPGAMIVVALEALVLAGVCAAVPAGPHVVRAASFPAVLVLTEAVRAGWPFGGLPIGGLALGQVAGPLGGSARLGGPLLLTGLVGIGGVACAEAVRTVRSRKVRWPAGPTLALVVLIGAVGAVAPDGGPAVGSVVIAAVQGGGLRGFSKEQVNPAVVLAAQFQATATLEQAGGPRPSIVLWPEDVISLNTPLAGTAVETEMSQLAESLDATVLAGVTQTVSLTAFRNDEVAWAPNGQIVGDYEKVHRVPFGEYVPDRSFFSHIANLSAVPLDAVPGHGTGLMVTPDGKLGLMISYEVFYANRGRSATRAGARLLLVPTNTSSYATSQMPSQEIAAAEMQAIEEGRDLVQAAPTGFSAVIDHRGVLHQCTALGKRQVLVTSVAFRTGSTVYERFGDTPVLALASLGLLGTWGVEMRSRRRSRRPRDHPSR